MSRTCSALVARILAVVLLVFALPLQGTAAPVRLMFKCPVLSMHAENDPELQDISTFLRRATKAFQAQYKDAELAIDVVTFRLTEEDDAITGCFDTPYAPDLLFEGYFNMSGYIHTGRVVPVDDILSEAIRKDVPDALWDMSQANNGKTYMVPFFSLQNTLGCNVELMKTCGLERFIASNELIRHWNLEEWETVLSTLKEKLPQGKYGYAMYARNDQGDTHVMTLLRACGSKIFDDKGRFCLNTPEGIAGLRLMKSWYDKGFFPPLCETLEITDCAKLFSNGQMTFYTINAAVMHPKVKTTLVNFPSKDGNGYATSFAVGFEVFDNGDPVKVKACKDFLKFILETEEWRTYSGYTAIPCFRSVIEKMRVKNPLLGAYFDNSANVVDFTANNPNWRGVRSVFYTHIQDLFVAARTPEEVAADIDEECNAAIEEGYSTSKLHD